MERYGECLLILYEFNYFKWLYYWRVKAQGRNYTVFYPYLRYAVMKVR